MQLFHHRFWGWPGMIPNMLWSPLITFLSLKSLGIISGVICSIIFLGIKVTVSSRIKNKNTWSPMCLTLTHMAMLTHLKHPRYPVAVFLETPELDAGLQLGSYEIRVKGEKHLLWPAGHASFYAAQVRIGFLDCGHTLSAYI